MGRFFGWVGPAAYLLAVAFAVLCGVVVAGDAVAPLAMGAGPRAMMPSGPVDTVALVLMSIGTTLVFTPAGLLLAATWLLAALWFVFQAAILHARELDDELWTSHMLAVGFVGRLALMPLCVALTVSAATLVARFFAMGFEATFDLLSTALWLELLAAVLALPFALFQVCAATRLANRGLAGATGAVGHALLAFLPTVGFVSMCALYVNGREALWAAHDARIAREAADGVAAGSDATAGDDEPAGPVCAGEREETGAVCATGNRPASVEAEKTAEREPVEADAGSHPSAHVAPDGEASPTARILPAPPVVEVAPTDPKGVEPDADATGQDGERPQTQG